MNLEATQPESREARALNEAVALLELLDERRARDATGWLNEAYELARVEYLRALEVYHRARTVSPPLPGA